MAVMFRYLSIVFVSNALWSKIANSLSGINQSTVGVTTKSDGGKADVSLDSTLNASDLSLDTTTEIIDGADSTSGNENNEQTGKATVSYRELCYKQGGNWSRSASRNCFWDRYWWRASQLLVNFFGLSPVTVPEVFAEVNSFKSSSRFHSGEWKPRGMSTFPFYITVFSLGARRQIAKK